MNTPQAEIKRALNSESQASSIIAWLLCGWSSLAGAACPDLSEFYPEGRNAPVTASSWEDARTRLGSILDQCLFSSEFFALYGAAQLNTAQLPNAMESLERSLLLDPENGAALIDYADALLRDGQLFAAIEANTGLLSREDLPSSLASEINQRQRDWVSLTRETSWQLDLLGGYDDNLNGAPENDLVTLTLSGQPILLTLNERFRAVQGPFLNARFLARHRRLSPEHQHSFLGQIRGRVSENTESDILQISGRYDRLTAAGRKSWQWGGGLNHLLLSGRPLFTGTDAFYRFQIGNFATCQPYTIGALQHQLWHEQRLLNGIEAKIGLGGICPLQGGSSQRVSFEGSFLHDGALQNGRLGGNRDGWQFKAEWQIALSHGLLSAQINHTRLLDGRGYSPLLGNNARRSVERSFAVIQYVNTFEWFDISTQFVINLYHQNQRSNLELFRTGDSSLEAGFSWRF